MHWNIGLDIGASGVRMAIKGRGVLYRQSAAIAHRQGSNELLEVGNEALRMVARAPEGVAVGFPMGAGTVRDELLLLGWYQYLFRHASAGGLIRRPHVLIACPPGMHPSPMRHMVALAMQAGAASCAAVRSDAAAALGAPVDILRPQATLVVELGAGSMGASLFAGGRPVCAHTLPFGMQRVDEDIVRRVRRAHGMAIGLRQAEDLKLSLVGVSAAAAPRASIHAMDAKTGFPRLFEIDAEDVKDAVQPALSALIELIHQVIDCAPTELAADLNDTGVVLTGGGAQLFGLPLMISEAFGLPCHLTEDPSACVIRGLNSIMESGDKYEHLLAGHTTVMEKRLPGK